MTPPGCGSDDGAIWPDTGTPERAGEAATKAAGRSAPSEANTACRARPPGQAAAATAHVPACRGACTRRSTRPRASASCRTGRMPRRSLEAPAAGPWRCCRRTGPKPRAHRPKLGSDRGSGAMRAVRGERRRHGGPRGAEGRVVTGGATPIRWRSADRTVDHGRDRGAAADPTGAERHPHPRGGRRHPPARRCASRPADPHAAGERRTRPDPHDPPHVQRRGGGGATCDGWRDE